MQVTKTMAKPANAQPGNTGVPNGPGPGKPAEGTQRSNGGDKGQSLTSPSDSSYSSTAGSK